jgi:hypothetical protein
MGKGWSYGMEVFAEKKSGKTTGWIGYTLSWTMRQFDNINFGEPYPYKYDRRHDISVVVAHKFNKQFDIGVTWVYGTGNALTLPVMRAMAQTDYYYPGYYSEIEYFEKKNDFRMAAYHRLDFSANWNFHVGSADATLNLSVYNCYSRRNPFFYYFGYDNYGHRVLYRVSLFPVIPALSINFKFLNTFVMKNISLFIVIVLIISNLHFSCTKVEDIVDFPIKDPKLTLNCYFHPDSVWAFSVSRSLSVIDNANLSMVTDATVKLYENNNLLATLTSAAADQRYYFLRI